VELTEFFILHSTFFIPRLRVALKIHHSSFNLLHSLCKGGLGGALTFIIHHSTFCIPWVGMACR
jgi:hypothetical protein